MRALNRTVTMQIQMRYHFLMDLFGSGLGPKAVFGIGFGVAVELGLPMELSYFTVNGALDFSDSGVIRLTTRGKYLFVVMMREFFIGINEFRDQARLSLTPDDGTEGRSCGVGRGSRKHRAGTSQSGVVEGCGVSGSGGAKEKSDRPER